MTVIGQITPDDIVTFLATLGVEAFASYDGHLPDSPDQVVAVAMTGGPGYTFEQALDNVAFQMHTRGAANDDKDAALLAWQVDYALVPPPLADPCVPAMVGSQRVQMIQRAGGPPAFLKRDDNRRAHYTGNYIFTVTRA